MWSRIKFNAGLRALNFVDNRARFRISHLRPKEVRWWIFSLFCVLFRNIFYSLVELNWAQRIVVLGGRQYEEIDNTFWQRRVEHIPTYLVMFRSTVKETKHRITCIFPIKRQIHFLHLPLMIHSFLIFSICNTLSMCSISIVLIYSTQC